MKQLKNPSLGANPGHGLIRRWAWVLGLVPLAGGAYSLAAQQVGSPAARAAAEIKQRQRPQAGTIIFNDQSPRPSRHNLAGSTYVGYKVCSGCHGALSSTRPGHTLIQEWESASNAHANDGAKLAGGRLNVYNSLVADGETVDGVKSCATCHTTGAPKFNEPQISTLNGYDPSQPFNEHTHNVQFLRVQCENCHGAGSKHVLSGGDPRFINRVPDPKETCWNCHVHAPNEKGNLITAAATDEQIAKYSSSLGHSHAAGALVAGTGGFEYTGEDYSQGHNQPHTRIKTTCVTCHTPRDPRSPILNHSDLAPKIQACRNCHTDSRKVASLESWTYLENRQKSITQLLIQLGGASSTDATAPDANASGGLLGHAADKTGAAYKRARWNYALVLNDGSLGAHNYDYALELLLTSIANAPAQATPAAH